MADPISPFTPTMQQQIEQLLQSQIDRSNSSTPIHQAAMAMAAHMAPGYAQSAMTGPSSVASGGGGLTPSSSGSSGPGVASTVSATVFAALLKNPKFLALLRGLLPTGAADPTFGGLIQGNKPFAGGTGFPDVPVGGAPSSSGGMSGIPGYFRNPDGSLVGVGGDPANGGGYGGGLFGGTGVPDVDNPGQAHD